MRQPLGGFATIVTDEPARCIMARTHGAGHGGPIVRLMSPSDFGQLLKPFVFLDLFDSEAAMVRMMPVHPHSGIATVTVLTEGDLTFDKPGWGRGRVDYGGVEWMRAGSGVWHGDEMSPGDSARIKGFQLWIALPAELEESPAEWQFVEAADIPRVGPAHLILGEYDGAQSPVRSPEGVNYLLVTLEPGEAFTYSPPETHAVCWLSVAAGGLFADTPIEAGELVAFERTGGRIALRAGEAGARFVLGSAAPHPHELVLGSYSVHTSRARLQTGEARIAALRPVRI